MNEFSILYVEDDEDTREELSLFLKQKCHTLHVCQNGQEGFETYKAVSPDLIISDIQMPVLNGIEMATKIRRIDQFVPIIFITAFNEVSYLKASLEIKVTNYVTKPVDLAELGVQIESIFYPEKSFILSMALEEDFTIKSSQGFFKELTNSRDDLVGKNIIDFIQDEYKDRFVSSVKNLKNGGFMHREKIFFTTKDNSSMEFLVDGENTNDDTYNITLTKMQYFVNSYTKVHQLLKKEKDLRRVLIYKKNIHIQMLNSSTVKEFFDNICNCIIEYHNYSFALIYTKSNENEYKLISFTSCNETKIEDFTPSITIQKDDKLTTTTPLLIQKEELKDYPFFANPSGIIPDKVLIVPIFLCKGKAPLGFYLLASQNLSPIVEEEFYKGDNIGLTIGIGQEMIENKIDLSHTAKCKNPLTKIHNFYAFNQILDISMLKSRDNDTSISLMHLNIEDIEDKNDNTLLVDISKNILKHIKCEDSMAHICDEKFAILVHVNLHEAKKIADEIVKNNKRSTLNIGIAQYDAKNHEEKSSFIKRADLKLNHAKTNGKNQIAI